MNENRYAPPVAAVADIEAAPLADRPRNVVIGVNLLWLQLALGIPGMINRLLQPQPVEMPEGQIRTVYFVMMSVVIAGSVLLYALINWKSWQGRNWARIVHLVFLCLGLVMVFLAVSTIFKESTFQGVVYVVKLALNIAGVALLFSPAANAWYRAMKSARR